jgi:cytoskeletal protein CcmA (bactofilin family)
VFSNKGRDERTSPSGQTNGRGRGMFSVIGPDMIVTGNVRATADLHIDGGIEGDVQCGNLVQGSESRIVGGVTADTARIAGSIEGSVCVKHLTVERSARIIGDVEYEDITIENGGHVDGRLKRTGGDAAVSGPRAVPKLTPPAAQEQAA